MKGRNTHAIRVGKLLLPFPRQFQKSVMRQRNDFFLGFAAVGSDEKLYVHRIGVPDGDASLEPPKLHFPHPPERVRTRLKQAALVTHDPMLTCGAGAAVWEVR